MATHAATALWALSQLRRLPAMSSLARPEAHFRGSSFWHSHVA